MAAGLSQTKTATYVGTVSGNKGIYANRNHSTVPGYPNWPVPGYTGFHNISVSSITMGAIDTNTTSEEIPFTLFASAKNVTASASRTKIGGFRAYDMLEHKWTLTYSDGSIIDWWEEDAVIDARGKQRNPYTDIISPEFCVPIRKAGTYTLTLESRGPGISATGTATITATACTMDHLWVDGSAGNNTNDGFDPWGFGLTTAGYTESTGELTQSGAFASYDHSAATAGNPTDWYNWIYISGGDGATTAGWYQIASKTDNNTIVLQDKLGADDTNVTSSNGAKQTFTGSTLGSNNDEWVHLRGNNGVTSYSFDDAFAFATGTSNNSIKKRISGYDADADGTDILATTNITGDFRSSVLGTRVNNGSGNAEYGSAHNLDIDCAGFADAALGGSISDANATDRKYYFIDRVSGTNGRDGTIFSFPDNAQAGPHEVCIWKCSLDNLVKTALFTGAHDGGNNQSGESGQPITDSGESWATNEWADYAVFNTTDGSRGVVDSNTATTLTVTSNGMTHGTDDDWDTGDVIEIHWAKAHAMFMNLAEGSRQAFVGCDVQTNSTKRTPAYGGDGRDHYVYFKGYHDNRFYGYNRFRNGVGCNFVFNLDFTGSAGEIQRYFSVVENFADGDLTRFCDFSGSNNAPLTEGSMENLLVARNACGGDSNADGFINHACGTKITVLDNVVFNGGQLHGMGGDNRNMSATDVCIARNKSYSTGNKEELHSANNDSGSGVFEVTDNEQHSTDTDVAHIRTYFPSAANCYIDGNNFYAPNDPNGDVMDDTNASLVTVSSFNTTFSASNTTTDPSWTDPSNGDFT